MLQSPVRCTQTVSQISTFYGFTEQGLKVLLPIRACDQHGKGRLLAGLGTGYRGHDVKGFLKCLGEILFPTAELR
jgi:hypothetical protein